MLQRYESYNILSIGNEQKLVDSREEQKLRKYFADELEKEGIFELKLQTFLIIHDPNAYNANHHLM